jgi:hypothetical protein
MRRNARVLYLERFEALQRLEEERREIGDVAHEHAKQLVHDVVSRNLPKGMRNTPANRAKVQTALETEIKARTNELPTVKRYFALNDEIAAMRVVLDAMALMLKPEPGDLRLVIMERTSGDFQTTGNGTRYAEGLLKVRAAEITFNDHQVRTEIDVETIDGAGKRFTLFAFLATEADRDLLSRRPGFSVKNYLKACWGVGVNPRVFNPMLPHGLEEKLGLDYFGGEKP